MDIKDRIIQIIETEQLTSSKFADIVGIQRSSISHILSGRNNPSLEIIQKILTTFGTLDSDWLLFGRGSMYRTGRSSQKLFEEEPVFKQEKDTEKKIENKSVDISDLTEPEEEQENLDEAQQTTPPKKEKQITGSNSRKRRTEKIIIFNSDKTFSEYFPEEL